MKILKDSLWANGSALITQIIALGTTLIVARFVGPNEYGLVATGLVILLFFQRFLLESFGFSVIREMDTSGGYLESANYCSIVFGYISTVIMFLAGIVLYYFSYQNLSLVIVALSIIPILDGYGTIRTCLLRRDGKFKQLAGRVLIANTCAGLFAVGLAVKSFGIWALITQQIILALCNLLIAFKYANWKPLNKVNKNNIKKIMKFGFPMMGNSVVFVAANRVDVLFLSFLSNPLNVGTYSMARRITRTIPDIIVNGSNSVLMTHLRGKNKADALSLTISQIKYVFLILIPFLLYFSVFSNDLVGLIFGEKWRNTSMGLIIPFLCILSIFQVIISLLNTLLLNWGMSKKVFIVNVVQLLFFLFFLTYGALSEKFDAIFVSKYFILSQIFSFVLVIYMIFKLNFFVFFKNFVVFLPISYLCYLIFCIEYSDIVIINMVISLINGFLVYFFIFFIFDRDIRNLFSLIKDKLLN